MVAYDWDEKLREGVDGENFIAEILRLKGFEVEFTDEKQQKAGIDLFADGHPVEVKTDSKAAKTGNLFLEVQDSRGNEGGLLISTAEWVVFYVPHHHVFIVETEELQDFLREYEGYLHRIWSKSGPRRWSVGGFAIPIEKLESLPSFRDLL